MKIFEMKIFNRMFPNYICIHLIFIIINQSTIFFYFSNYKNNILLTGIKYKYNILFLEIYHTYIYTYIIYQYIYIYHKYIIHIVDICNKIQ